MTRFARLPKPRTGTERHSALMMFLYSARIEKVREATVEHLMRLWGCDARVTEYELRVALQKRAGE